MQSQYKLRHVPALDGLRGIAVVLVVLYHAELPLVRGGFLGVDVFFVLSGFLITSLLLEEWQRTGTIRLSYFYARRALRLLPALYVMLLVVAIYTALFVSGPMATVNWVGIFLASIYSSNLGAAVGLTDLGALSHTWSLGVEEQFYLLWPFILIIVLSSARRSPARLVAITVSSLVFFAMLRFVLGVVGGEGALVRISGLLDIRGDSLLAGGLVAILLAYYPVTPRIRARLLYFLRLILPVVLSISTLFVIIASGSWPLLKFGGFTFVALSVAMLIAYMMLCPEGLPARLLSWEPLARIGTVSYGIYLWHAPVFVLLPLPSPHDWLVLQNWPVQMTRIVLASGCVILSYRFVERPALQLKERFSASQQAAPTTHLQVRGRTVQPVLEALDE